MTGQSSTFLQQVVASYLVIHKFFQDMNLQMAMDNPYWPNGSAVERAKDSAANLPPPNATKDEAEWTLTEHDIECLAAGAGILASGGGGDPKEACERARQVLIKRKKLKVVNPCR